MKRCLILEKSLKIRQKRLNILNRKKISLCIYSLFCINKGIDVNSVYEAELKDIPTNRFNEWMKKQIEEDDQPPEISFESQASYEPIHEGPMPQPIRPN